MPVAVAVVAAAACVLAAGDAACSSTGQSTRHPRHSPPHQLLTGTGTQSVSRTRAWAAGAFVVGPSRYQDAPSGVS